MVKKGWLKTMLQSQYNLTNCAILTKYQKEDSYYSFVTIIWMYIFVLCRFLNPRGLSVQLKNTCKAKTYTVAVAFGFCLGSDPLQSNCCIASCSDSLHLIGIPVARISVCLCVCVWVRERNGVYVCVWERDVKKVSMVKESSMLCIIYP